MPDSWQRRISPPRITPSTGSYFIIVEIESSPEERTPGRLFTDSASGIVFPGSGDLPSPGRFVNRPSLK
jgi:hypothetical protein